MKKAIISFLNELPYIKGLNAKNKLFNSNSCFSPGHFYSPIVSVEDLKERENEIWNEKKSIEGIKLRTLDQIELINQLSKYYNEIPFKPHKQNNIRYFFENEYYSYSDGILLYSMIRYFKPKRIIEIGSGFSSAVMLDTNELFFDNEISLTFIEPYPQRLFSLITKYDKSKIEVINKKVQSISLDIFKSLKSGDILFVDSSHVVKTDSDVNFILFNILPILKSGVLIHFHDIFYPFEYPKEWVFEGRNWNESYFLKAFLMYNSNFEIRLFSNYLHRYHKDAFNKIPLCYKNHGGNLWIEKN